MSHLQGLPSPPKYSTFPCNSLPSFSPVTPSPPPTFSCNNHRYTQSNHSHNHLKPSQDVNCVFGAETRGYIWEFNKCPNWMHSLPPLQLAVVSIVRFKSMATGISSMRDTSKTFLNGWDFFQIIFWREWSMTRWHLAFWVLVQRKVMLSCWQCWQLECYHLQFGHCSNFLLCIRGHIITWSVHFHGIILLCLMSLFPPVLGSMLDLFSIDVKWALISSSKRGAATDEDSWSVVVFDLEGLQQLFVDGIDVWPWAWYICVGIIHWWLAIVWYKWYSGWLSRFC